jgi:hypothetical protein
MPTIGTVNVEIASNISGVRAGVAETKQLVQQLESKPVEVQVVAKTEKAQQQIAEAQQVIEHNAQQRVVEHSAEQPRNAEQRIIDHNAEQRVISYKERAAARAAKMEDEDVALARYLQETGKTLDVAAEERVPGARRQLRVRERAEAEQAERAAESERAQERDRIARERAEAETQRARERAEKESAARLSELERADERGRVARERKAAQDEAEFQRAHERASAAQERAERQAMAEQEEMGAALEKGMVTEKTPWQKLKAMLPGKMLPALGIAGAVGAVAQVGDAMMQGARVERETFSGMRFAGMNEEFIRAQAKSVASLTVFDNSIGLITNHIPLLGSVLREGFVRAAENARELAAVHKEAVQSMRDSNARIAEVRGEPMAALRLRQRDELKEREEQVQKALEKTGTRVESWGELLGGMWSGDISGPTLLPAGEQREAQLRERPEMRALYDAMEARNKVLERQQGERLIAEQQRSAQLLGIASGRQQAGLATRETVARIRGDDVEQLRVSLAREQVEMDTRFRAEMAGKYREQVVDGKRVQVPTAEGELILQRQSAQRELLATQQQDRIRQLIENPPMGMMTSAREAQGPWARELSPAELQKETVSIAKQAMDAAKDNAIKHSELLTKANQHLANIAKAVGAPPLD